MCYLGWCTWLGKRHTPFLPQFFSFCCDVKTLGRLKSSGIKCAMHTVAEATSDLDGDVSFVLCFQQLLPCSGHLAEAAGVPPQDCLMLCVGSCSLSLLRVYLSQGR